MKDKVVSLCEDKYLSFVYVVYAGGETMSCETKSMLLASELGKSLSNECCNKQWHSEWLRKTRIYCLTIQEVTHLTRGSRVKTKVIEKLCFFLEALREYLFCCLFQFWGITCILRAHLPWLYLESQEFSIFKFPSVHTLLIHCPLSLKKTLAMTLSPHR